MDAMEAVTRAGAGAAPLLLFALAYQTKRLHEVERDLKELTARLLRRAGALGD